MAEPWQTHFSRSLLGRWRLQLFKEITGTDDVLPTNRDGRRFLLRRFRENAFAAGFYRDLLHINVVCRARFADLPTPNVPELVGTLESQPLDSPQFVEIVECPEPFSAVTGAVVRCEHLEPSGYVYSVILVDEPESPDVGFFEVRTFAQDPSPLILAATRSGSINLEHSYSESPQARLVFQILCYLATHRRFQFLAPEDVPRASVAPELEGPDDSEFDRLARLVRTGQVACSDLIVPAASVRPFSIQHCLRITKHEIQEFVPEVERSHPRLLVYWNGKALVTSDDYLPYLAYRSLNMERIPVTIMGEYPAELGEPERTGGWELIPKIVIDHRGTVAEDSGDAELVLKNRLERSRAEAVPGELYALFMILAELIQNRSTAERDIHEFLYRNPTALDAYGGKVLSEVWLGRDSRIDLVVQYRTAERQIALIELESPRKVLFTKNGRLRAEITHALQQVEDWLRWWREHPTEIPSNLDPTVAPQGMVIVGRKSELTSDEQRRLAHLNDTRDVKLLTYDDLLDRLEAMIESLESVYD